MSFIGNPLVSMNYPVDYFTGDGSTYIFTLSNTPASTSSIIVSVNGTKLVSVSSNPGYYLNGSTLTLSNTPPLNATIEVVYLGVLSQVNVPADLSITEEMLPFPISSNNLLYITTANGSQSIFTLPYPPISSNSVIVTANGVVQYDYTVNESNLVLNFTPPNGTVIRAQSLAYTNQLVPVDGSVSSSKLQSNLVLTGNTTVDNLTVTGDLTANVTVSNIPNSSLANSSITINGTSISLGSSGSITAGATITDDTTTNATRYLMLGSATSGAYTSANVSSTKLTFNPSTGTLSVTALTETSSETLKENIHPLENALESVLLLNSKIYDRKDGSSKNEVGLIAEEVNCIIPNIVSKDENGSPVGIHYTKLTAYLIESIKSLRKEIEELKNGNS